MQLRLQPLTFKPKFLYHVSFKTSEQLLQSRHRRKLFQANLIGRLLLSAFEQTRNKAFFARR